MKIVAIVEKSYRGLTPSGGAETMIHDLLGYLLASGWEVHALVCVGKEAEATIDGVSVTITQDKEKFHRIASSADVILTQLGGTPRARWTGAGYNIPVVQLIHNTNEFSVGFLGDGCDLAIYNAAWVSDYHDLHRKDPLIRAWEPHGSSYLRKRKVTEWPSIIVRPPVVDEYKDISDRDGYITLINLVENKGPGLMYDLASENPQWKFMGVVGGYQLDSQYIRTDLPNVKIQDHVLNIDEIFSQTSILIVPSLYESYGRVAAEAMSRGVPVIASDTPGLKECLDYNHLIRDRDDRAGWEQAIRWVYSHYEDAQEIYLNRHNQLYDQTWAELALFKDTMEALVNEWA